MVVHLTAAEAVELPAHPLVVLRQQLAPGVASPIRSAMAVESTMSVKTRVTTMRSPRPAIGRRRSACRPSQSRSRARRRQPKRRGRRDLVNVVGRNLHLRAIRHRYPEAPRHAVAQVVVFAEVSAGDRFYHLAPAPTRVARQCGQRLRLRVGRFRHGCHPEMSEPHRASPSPCAEAGPGAPPALWQLPAADYCTGGHVRNEPAPVLSSISKPPVSSRTDPTVATSRGGGR